MRTYRYQIKSVKREICLLLMFMVMCCAFPALRTVDAAQSSSSAEPQSEQAPDFFLRDMDGNPVQLSAHRGKVVILTFWASWCVPCKTELASLNTLQKKYRGKGLVVLAVSIDRTRDAAKSYLAKNPVGYPALHDEQALVSRKLYRVFGVPATFVIDRKGTIVSKRYGEPDWMKPEIVDEMERLLK